MFWGLFFCFLKMNIWLWRPKSAKQTWNTINNLSVQPTGFFGHLGAAETNAVMTFYRFSHSTLLTKGSVQLELRFRSKWVQHCNVFKFHFALHQRLRETSGSLAVCHLDTLFSQKFLPAAFIKKWNFKTSLKCRVGVCLPPGLRLEDGSTGEELDNLRL